MVSATTFPAAGITNEVFELWKSSWGIPDYFISDRFCFSIRHMCKVARKLLHTAFKNQNESTPNRVRTSGRWRAALPFLKFYSLQKPEVRREKPFGAASSPGCIIRGLAPRYARFTLAFLPSMMGLGSLHALSAAALSAMVTLTGDAAH